jgi:hypothetical protein
MCTKLFINLVASINHWSRAQMYVLRIAINNMFKWVFSRVLASPRGGPGLNQSWDF